MSESKQNFSIEVEGKKAVCPLGEVVGNKMIPEAERKDLAKQVADKILANL